MTGVNSSGDSGLYSSGGSCTVGYAIAVAVITILPMTMTLVDAKLFPVYLLIWLMFGFSLTAYADSWFMWKLFKPYFKEEEEEHHYVDTEPDQYAF